MIRFRTRGVPEAGDPIGGSPHATPGSVWLPAEMIEDPGNGTLRVRVTSPFGEVIVEDAVEGGAPGQVETSTGLARTVTGSFLSRLRALANDDDPIVRLSIAAVAGIHRDRQPAQVAFDLLGIAEDTGRPGLQRAVALLWLERLIPDGRT